jgi:hypothetical protein
MALAYALGLTRSALYQWKKIPQGRAFEIQILTGGKFKAVDLLAANKLVKNTKYNIFNP